MSDFYTFKCLGFVKIFCLKRVRTEQVQAKYMSKKSISSVRKNENFSSLGKLITLKMFSQESSGLDSCQNVGCSAIQTTFDIMWTSEPKAVFWMSTGVEKLSQKLSCSSRSPGNLDNLSSGSLAHWAWILSGIVGGSPVFHSYLLMTHCNASVASSNSTKLVEKLTFYCLFVSYTDLASNLLLKTALLEKCIFRV